MEITEIQLSDIFADYEFNSRGVPTQKEYVDLARSIKEQGLQTPITVTPWYDKYKIVCGHCRYLAVRTLGWDTIQAIIQEGLTDEQARILNLTENLVRSNLNLSQEAKSVGALRDLGVSPDEIGSRLQQSRHWVNVRLAFLTLPEDIQREVSNGLIPQEEIRRLAHIEDRFLQRKEFERFKQARLEGKKKIRVAKPPTPGKLTTKRRRQAAEIIEMRTRLEAFLAPDDLVFSVMDWAAGIISDLRLYEAVNKNIDPDYDSKKLPLRVMPTLA